MKELHIWIKELPNNSLNTYFDVVQAMNNGDKRIDTGITSFCCMDNIHLRGYTIIVHSMNDGNYVIDSKGCSRVLKELRPAHNLRKLLLGGMFGEMPKKLKL